MIAPRFGLLRSVALLSLVGMFPIACGVTTDDIIGDAGIDGSGDAATSHDGARPRADGASPVDAVTKDHQSASDGSAGSGDGSSSGDGDATSFDDGQAPDGGTLDGESPGHDGGGPVLTTSPASLAFGDVTGKPGFATCGSTPPTETFTVKNTGTATTSWWADFALGTASPYSLSPACTPAAPCAIDAGASTIVTVTPPSIPTNAGIVTHADTVTVLSTASGGQGSTVALTETSYGAILAFDPIDQNFGSQPSSGSYTSPALQILNSGNAPVTATIGTSPMSSTLFSLSSSDVVAPAGSSGTFTVTYAPAGSTAAATGAVMITGPASPICAPLPEPMTLEGQGTVAMITVTPVLNFNTGQNGGVGVSCGSTADSQSVVVTNSGSGTAHITALTFAQGAGSAFSTSAVLPMTVMGGDSVTVQVFPNMIPSSSPPGAILDDVLTVTTDMDAGAYHRVTIHETTAGAVLSLSLPTNASGPLLAFSSTARGGTGTYPFTVTNSGNVAAPLLFDSGSSLVTFPTGVTVSASANSAVDGTFKPTAAATLSTTGSVAAAPGTPVCSGFGGTIPLSITGTSTTGNTYSVGSSSLGFGTNSCGAGGAKGTPPAAQTVTLTNDGAATTWAAALTGSGASFFELSATSGTLPGLFLIVPGTTSFTVTPYGLGSASGLSGLEVELGVFATLTVTLGTGTGAETFTIPISETPSGVFAEWNLSQVTVLEGSPSASFALLNLSSYGATFDLASGSASFTLGTTSGQASAGAPLTSSLTDDATTAATTSVTASLGSTTSQLCGPLPAPLPVVGR